MGLEALSELSSALALVVMLLLGLRMLAGRLVSGLLEQEQQGLRPVPRSYDCGSSLLTSGVAVAAPRERVTDTRLIVSARVSWIDHLRHGTDIQVVRIAREARQLG